MRIKKQTKAFTLIELLVSISILAFISAISIYAYPRFSEQLSATAESFRVLSFFKETQVFGVGSYTEPGKRSLYAIEIIKNQPTTPDGISNTDIIRRLRIDEPTDISNQYYRDNLNADSIDSIYPTDRYYIAGICTEFDCTPETSNISHALVVYRRPNPEARIITLQGEDGGIINPDNSVGTFSRLIIFVQHKNKEYARKKIVVLSTGQMYTQDW